jgi:hypothetical protein
MGSCTSCIAGWRNTDVPLSKGHLQPGPEPKVFNVARWSGVIFFEPVCDRDKDFWLAFARECSGSLADTASERGHLRSGESDIPIISVANPANLRRTVSSSLAHDTPRGSCQKRQKIFDYAQQGHLLATREVPKLEDLGPRTPTDLEISSQEATAQ